MKFNPKYRPDEVASRDETRTHFVHVELDVKGKRLVATDGHCLVAVPCMPDESDRSGPIPVAAIREARASYKRTTAGFASRALLKAIKFEPPMPTIRARAKLLDVNKSIMYRRPDAGKFPPWEQVIPKERMGEKGTHSITLNPDLLMRVSRAMGWHRHGLVTITQSTEISRRTGETTGGEMLSPILVTKFDEPEVIGVVMPARR